MLFRQDNKIGNILEHNSYKNNKNNKFNNESIEHYFYNIKHYLNNEN